MAPVPPQTAATRVRSMVNAYFTASEADAGKTETKKVGPIEITTTSPSLETLKTRREGSMKLIPDNAEKLEAYNRTITNLLVARANVLPSYQKIDIFSDTQWAKTKDTDAEIEGLRAKEMTKEERALLEVKLKALDEATKAMKEAQDVLVPALERTAKKEIGDLEEDENARGAIIYVKQAMADDAVSKANKILEAQRKEREAPAPRMRQEDGRPPQELPEALRDQVQLAMSGTGGGSTVPRIGTPDTGERQM
ncbi:MAG: hypothetical protein K2Q01_02080 [Rickettsiales bacterium]|nr:hypothetical protein [Rickettsiales bacterium]